MIDIPDSALDELRAIDVGASRSDGDVIIHFPTALGWTACCLIAYVVTGLAVWGLAGLLLGWSPYVLTIVLVVTVLVWFTTRKAYGGTPVLVPINCVSGAVDFPPKSKDESGSFLVEDVIEIAGYWHPNHGATVAENATFDSMQVTLNQFVGGHPRILLLELETRTRPEHRKPFVIWFHRYVCPGAKLRLD